MSDRTKSSVRTGARGDGDAAGGSTPESAPPVTSTQSIPGASTPRTQGTPVAGSQPATAAAVPPTSPADGGTPGSPATRDSATRDSATRDPATRDPATRDSTTGDSATGDSATADPAAVPAAVSGKRSRSRSAKVGGRGPRRARLQLRHVDIWSAFKISFVLSIAMFFIWMVAVGVLYGVLSALGVFTTLNTLFGQLGSASGSEVAGDVVTPGLVFGGAAVIGAINIVLMTALCTVGTFIYNLCSDLVGGLELTLSERD